VGLITEEKLLEGMVNNLLIGIIENLIEEVESQGMTYVTTDTLRKFIHNIETNTKVVGKVYKGIPNGK